MKENTGTFTIKKSETFTEEFVTYNPQFKDVIANLSEPSLSADIDADAATFGRSFGFFFTSSESHRWATLGVGLGLSYLYGEYKINVCNPYTITANTIASPLQLLPSANSREGVCVNKNNLYLQRINHFGLAVDVLIKLYSYIGDTFEVNVFEIDAYIMESSWGTINNTKKDEILSLIYNPQYLNIFSLYYRL